MAITTLDGVLAGMQKPQFFSKFQWVGTGAGSVGRHYSSWGVPGIPCVGSYDNTLSGVHLQSISSHVPGMIPRSNPVSGNAYLGSFTVGSNMGGQVLLCDRLWHNGGLSVISTSPQTINSGNLYPRDINGSNAGEGVYAGLEVQATVGAGTPTITLTYTNSDGVSGRTGINITSTSANSAASSFYLIGLQSGDKGIASIQTIQLNATWTSGVINLVLFRIIAAQAHSNSQFGFNQTVLTSGLPRIYNGTVPFILIAPQGTASPIITGTYVETHG